ncbi:UDP-N-acetylmuramoyl-tripeptide--D-alanyl-D-alanine ligase [compost metagenome]
MCNGDEPLIAEGLKEVATHKPDSFQKTTFGLDKSNDEFPVNMTFTSESVIFTTYQATCQGKEQSYHLPLLGQHNVVNCLAALIVARHYGVTEDNIVQGLVSLQLTGMRIEIIACDNGVTILNDAYNASPTSMKAAIDVLQNMNGYHKKIAILGDMLELGAQEQQFHMEIGRLLNQSKIDYLFTIGDLGKCIAAGARERLDENNIYAYTNKVELAHKLEEMLSPNDVVLVKASRGMALEKVVEQIKQMTIQS